MPTANLMWDVSFLSLQNLSLSFFLVFKLCKHLKTLFTYYSACLSVHAYEYVCLERHVEARGKLCRVGFLLPPFREFKDQIQGARLLWQTPFPAESSCWLLFQLLKTPPVTHPSHRLLLCVFQFSCLRFSFVGLNLYAAKLSPM